MSWTPARTLTLLVSFAALSAATASAQASRRGEGDQPRLRCRDGDYDGDRERYCVVRDTTIAASQRIDVSPDQNGGIRVHGWNRSDVRVVSRIEGYA